MRWKCLMCYVELKNGYKSYMDSILGYRWMIIDDEIVECLRVVEMHLSKSVIDFNVFC